MTYLEAIAHGFYLRTIAFGQTRPRAALGGLRSPSHAIDFGTSPWPVAERHPSKRPGRTLRHSRDFTRPLGGWTRFGARTISVTGLSRDNGRTLSRVTRRSRVCVSNGADSPGHSR